MSGECREGGQNDGVEEGQGMEGNMLSRTSLSKRALWAISENHDFFMDKSSLQR